MKRLATTAALVTALVTALALTGCRTETTVRLVNLHVTAACPVPPNSYGQYLATGDFAPPAPGHSALLLTDPGGLTIDDVPGNVASLALMVTPSDESRWNAVAFAPTTGDLDMLLLPASSVCALDIPVGFTAGMLFGVVSPTLALANAGTSSFRVELGSGRTLAMAHGLKTPRTYAAFAPLGSTAALVAGGISGSVLEDNAEVFDVASGDFTGATVGPLVPRAHHVAVTLASGDVALVGGATTAVEIVSAVDRSVRSGQSLSVARNDPYVLRLATGTILVGGGTSPADGSVIATMEFFSPDFSVTLGAMPVVTRTLHAFVALDAGGALMVTAPDATDPPTFQRAWFVTPTTPPTPVVPDVQAALTDVKLVPSVGGKALLWTGSGWLRFTPWSNGFEAATDAPPAGPGLASPVFSPDPGLHTWVAADGHVGVWRESVRNMYASDAPLLGTSTELTSPDVLPAPSFSASTGLALSPNADVFVADARYLDVTADVLGPGSTLPFVVLRTSGGDLTCPPTPPTGTRLHVERHGGAMSFGVDGASLVGCGVLPPDVRVAVGVRGPSAGATVLGLTVTRLGVASP